jgi:hypothetical protein
MASVVDTFRELSEAFEAIEDAYTFFAADGDWIQGEQVARQELGQWAKDVSIALKLAGRKDELRMWMKATQDIHNAQIGNILITANRKRALFLQIRTMLYQDALPKPHDDMRIPMKTSTSSGHVVHPSERSDASVHIIHSSGRHGQAGIGFTSRFPLEIEPIGVMDQAVQDGIPDSWVGETGVPFCNRHLSDDHGGRSVIPVIQDFEQVLGLGAGEGIAQPVVKDQELHSGEGVEEFGIGAVGVGEGDMLEETRGALVTNGKVVAAGGVGQGTGEEGLADAGGAEDEDVEVLMNPLTLGKLKDQATVDTARGREVKVFDGSRERQVRLPQAPLEAVVIAADALAVDEHAEAILEGQVGVLRVVQLLFEGLTKSGQAELGQFVEQWLSKHSDLLNGSRFGHGCSRGRLG